MWPENLPTQDGLIHSVLQRVPTQPTSSTLKYLWVKGMPSEMKVDGGSSVVMGALDVRDAFLQAEQDEPVLVHLQNEPFIIMRNLPGQHLGAKQWYLHLRDILEKSMGFEFCPEEPCLARTGDATILIHVDNILYVGTEIFGTRFS